MKNKKTEPEVDESRRNILAAAVLAAPTAMLAGCVSEHGATDDVVATTSSALTVIQLLQQSCNTFYAMSNVLEIRINMLAADWVAVRDQEPSGGHCNWDFQGDDRFTYKPATSVIISGTGMPSHTFQTSVRIKKKSHCGSFSNERPCLKIDFNATDAVKNEAESFMGTSYVLLNNTLQDPSYIRTPLAFYLFKKAGLPAARCNFAKVFINNVLLGVYTNVEPVRERFIENNFGGGPVTGNLYEFENTDDFLASRIPYIDLEKASKLTNKADLTLAAAEVAKGVSALAGVINVGQFIRFHAMEFLLKDHDSYNGGVWGRGNNTYLYNNVEEVKESPTIDDVNFEFIPFGPDYILRPEFNFGIRDLNNSSIVGGLVRGDANLFNQLRLQIASYGDTVFSRANLTGPIKSFIDQMQTILTNLGAVPVGGTTASVTAGIAEVRGQLDLVRSAAWIISGLPNTTSLYMKDVTTGDELRASASQKIAGSTTDWEVVHRAHLEEPNNRWAPSGPRFYNEGNGGWLHFHPTLKTPANHGYIMTTPFNDQLEAKEMQTIAEQTHSFYVSGKFTLKNPASGKYLKFGTDDTTPGTGAQRAYQSDAAGATKLIVY